jgi:5-methyltetrahydropteroyltriglutamate--homocysteine methyltransferase
VGFQHKSGYLALRPGYIAQRSGDVAEIAELLDRAVAELPSRRVWVNPDCGLKTRGYDETVASLENLVAATRLVRERVEVSA